MGGFLERRFLKKSVRRWADLAARAGDIRQDDLRDLHRTALRLRRKLDLFTAAAGGALLPDPHSGIERPDQCDWAWRPAPWCARRDLPGVVELPSPHRLADDVMLFHDCARSEITLRQCRTTGHKAAAPYNMALDVYRFDGSFLSIVLSLPPEGVAGLTRGHFFSLRGHIRREQPLEVYARLNVQHGPNTEQMVRQLDFRDETGLAEFDLAYSNINEKRVDKAWIDLIFENPAMNRIQLMDLTLTRAPRADL